MAYFFGDSFDLYNAPVDALNGYWEAGSAAAFGININGRFTGSRCISLVSAAVCLIKSSGQNDAVHHIICAFYQSTAISGSTLGFYFQLSDGATNQVCICFRTDGAIELRSATPAGTLLATYTGAVTVASTWFAFEFEVVIHPTAGSFTVRKNGNTSNDFTATSLNTRPGTNSYANKLTIGINNSSPTQFFDDVLWRSDASAVPWVGDVRCYLRFPNTDVTAQWTRSSNPTVMTQSVVGNTNMSMAVGVCRLMPYTLSYSGNISSVTVVTTSTVSGNIKCAIYADNAGVPGSVLAAPAEQVEVNGNNVFTISPPLAVTSGQKIWIGCIGTSILPNWWVINGSVNAATASVTYATFPQANPTITIGQAFVGSTITTNVITANCLMVAELLHDDAVSYVQSSTVGQADLYTLGGISATPTTVIGVTTRGFLQKSDAGTRLCTVDVKSGSTTVSSTPGALLTSWGWIWRADANDPATGAAWTPTGVNNAQIGVTVTG